MLRDRDPEEADRLLGLAEAAVDQRWQTYEEMATRGPLRGSRADARRRLMDPDGPKGAT